MAGISSMGIGSGLDIGSLVDQLVAAERTPTQNRLNRQEALLQAKISAFGTIKSAISDFSGKVNALKDPNIFSSFRATSTDNAAITASTTSGASAGTYSVNVDQIAAAQSVASGAFAERTTVVGGGTMTFRFGAVTVDGGDGSVGFTQNDEIAAQTVDIAAGSTLADVRNAVNEADIGVTATIINDGSGERLIFTSANTGNDRGFIIETDDGDGVDNDNAGLSQLAFNTDVATIGNMTRTEAAADAQISIGGLAVTRSSNTFSDVIDGVTFNIKQVTDSAATISVAQSTGTAKDAITDFVSGYNELRQSINQLTAYDTETQQGAVLLGNATLRTISNSIRSVLSELVSGLENSSIRSLADIGITTNSDGTLATDTTKLEAALAESPELVGALFSESGQSTSEQLAFVDATSSTVPGTYDVNVTTVATRGTVNGASVLPADFSATPLTIDASNNTFRLSVDGITSRSIDLTVGDYSSGSALAAEIQTRINEDENLADDGKTVVVTYDSGNNRFVLSSSSYGSESTVEIVSADAGFTSDIGFAASDSGTGVDVAGTIGGSAATGVGQVLTADGGNARGLEVRYEGTTTGGAGSITYAKGLMGRLSDVLDNILASDGAIGNATEVLNDRVDDITEARERLAFRLEKLEARLVAQFTAMDTLVAQLNQTSDFLSNQLSGLQQLAQRAGSSSGNNR